MKRKRSTDIERPKKKSKGVRRKLDLDYLDKREQRIVIINKRLDGLTKKFHQLPILTNASGIIFIENPDTLSLNLDGTNSFNIQTRFLLLGNLIKLYYDFEGKSYDEFLDVSHKLFNIFKEDKNKIKTFIEMIQFFVNNYNSNEFEKIFCTK
jgi:hypothetical protein